MKTATILALAAGLMTLAGGAAADSASEGHDLALSAFSSVDRHGNGYVNLGDMEAYRELVFVSMDGNDDQRITLDEFLAWDFGFVPLAEDRDRRLAFETAMKVVFVFWDRNGDGAVTVTEHRHAIMADFRRADLNDDALLDEAEFTNGFSVIAAARVAVGSD